LTPRRILFLYAALALLTAFYPGLFGELPVPASSGLLVLPDAPRPSEFNELGDVPTEFLPWTRAVADSYRSGHLPLRFAANGCGTPLWANPQAQAVTPTTLFSLILPESWGSAAAACVKLFLAALGAFVFLQRRCLSPASAGWGGLVFGFSLHLTGWMHFPHTWPVALLPWTLVALDRLARGESGGFPATLIAVFLLLLGGYPEGEFYVALASAAFFGVVLLRTRRGARESARRFGLAAAASLLALGMTAAYTLPASLALAASERSRLVERSEPVKAKLRLSLGDLVKPPTYWDVSRFWIVPEAQGNPRDQDKFGMYSFAGRASGYAGILVVAFALATFFWRRAPAAVACARWALLLLALHVLWYPPLSNFLQTAPGIRQVFVRLTTNRANTVAVLLLAMLAAFELDRIRAGGAAWTTRWGIGLTLLFLCIVAVEYSRADGRPPMTAWRAASFLVPAVLLTAALILLSARISWRRSAALAVLLVAGTSVDLLRIGARFNPGTRPSDYFPVTPKVRELQAASRGGRFASSGPGLTGVSYMYGLEDVRVHDPVAPAHYVDVLVAATGYVGPGEYIPRVTRLEAPFLSFLNVRARFGDGPNPAIVVTRTPEAVLPTQLSGGALDACLTHTADFLAVACVEGADESFSGKARLVSYSRPRPELIRANVEVDSPRVLILPESNDGGWTAEGDGRPLTTLMANGAFLGIRVPAGRTQVVCRYLPPGFRPGVAITAGSFLIGIGIAVSRRRRIAQPATTPASIFQQPARRGARSSWRNTGAAAAPRGRLDRGPRSRRPGAAESASAVPP
jgi:hypothetical protein